LAVISITIITASSAAAATTAISVSLLPTTAAATTTTLTTSVVLVAIATTTAVVSTVVVTAIVSTAPVIVAPFLAVSTVVGAIVLATIIAAVVVAVAIRIIAAVTTAATASAIATTSAVIETRTRLTLRRAEVFARSWGSGTSTTGLLDAQGAALDLFALQTLLGSFGLVGSNHLHEAKASGLFGVRVTHDLALFNVAVLLEHFRNLGLTKARVDACDKEIRAGIDGTVVIIILGAGLVL
jgi:hypothetical protein